MLDDFDDFDIDIDAIKARLEAATPGPWEMAGGNEWVSPIGIEVGPCADEGVRQQDAEFIANAPSDIAALIEEVERLRGHIDRWVRGPLGRAYLSNLTKPPTAEQLAKHRHDGIGYCKECSGAMALWPCPIEVQRSWKDA